ncbi:hypothetical protein HispidOSU_007367 [Sigmodon hispidus]
MHHGKDQGRKAASHLWTALRGPVWISSIASLPWATCLKPTVPPLTDTGALSLRGVCVGGGRGGGSGSISDCSVDPLRLRIKRCSSPRRLRAERCISGGVVSPTGLWESWFVSTRPRGPAAVSYQNFQLLGPDLPAASYACVYGLHWSEVNLQLARHELEGS